MAALGRQQRLAHRARSRSQARHPDEKTHRSHAAEQSQAYYRTFLWCAALRRALRRFLAVCLGGLGALASCCTRDRPVVPLPRSPARRSGVPACLTLSCQVVTDLMVLPRTTRSVTSTLQAPSRVARRRCREAHSSKASKSSARPAPAAAAGAERSSSIVRSIQNGYARP